ncbi:S8 family serine peptidase, partial [Chloroflexota bacterium]
KLPKDADILSAVAAYRRNPNVEYAEPNYILHASVEPDDEHFSLQWGLDQDSDCDIDAPEAWDVETGNASIVIAVIDTGVDWDHPDLAANIWSNTDEVVDGNDTDGNGYIDDIRGWDFVNSDNDTMDDNGHGTHCAGTASAVTNNSIGVAGVSWNCQIMPAKVLNQYNSGSVTDVVNAITYAADNGANIASMSLGSYADASTLRDAVDYAYGQGVIMFAAAGNHNKNDRWYPAGYDNVTAVAATESNDAKTSISNFGSWIDVAAPGEMIYSTDWDDSYSYKSGTSMACPHVAGLAGLILSRNPGFNSQEVRTIIRSSTDNVTSTDEYIGLGRINAYQALQKDSIVVTHLDISLDDALIDGTYNITGTANGTDFASYSVYYGQGIYPASWTLINQSASPVAEGTLASWDTTSVNDGFYTIKLNATDIGGNVTQDMAVLIVYNPTLSVHNLNTGETFLRVQDAINDADTLNGHTITVDAKTYYENIRVLKSVTIQSTSGSYSDTIIHAVDSSDSAFYIGRDNVAVSGLTLTGVTGNYWSAIWLNGNANCNISSCNISGNSYAVKVMGGSTNVTIMNNTVNSNTTCGIYLQSSNYNTITNNTASSNLPYGYGIYLYSSSNNLISSNTGSNNGNGLIYLGSSSYNTIANNTAVNNLSGMYINSSTYNTFTGNTISSNTYDGIYFYSSSSYNTIAKNTASNNGNYGINLASSNNTLYLNNFISNDDGSVNGGSVSNWSSPTTLCYFYSSSHKNYFGNYYSDYAGSDTNADGIGNTAIPYTSGGANDNYPLTQTSGSYTVQAWYLHSDSIMYKANMGKAPGSVEITASGNHTWISDEAATTDIAFSNDTWTGQVVFTSAPANGHQFTVVLGYSTDGSDFIAGGPDAALTGDGSNAVFVYTTDASSVTVLDGKYLALRITNNSSSAYSVQTGGAWSYTSNPDTGAPAYPTPELPPILLITIGLVALGAFSLWRTELHSHVTTVDEYLQMR